MVPLKNPVPRQKPNYAEELNFKANGYLHVAGVDEAGRGAWAGPMVAAACILPPDLFAPSTPPEQSFLPSEHPLAMVRDSKQLSASQRTTLFSRIMELAVATGVAIIPPQTIDRLGLGRTGKLALYLALRNLPVRPQAVIVDCFVLPALKVPQRNIIKADALCLAVAAASIIAKVTRDRILDDYAQIYPAYGFATHKGYGTARHNAALNEFGPLEIHRFSYAPLLNLLARENSLPELNQSSELLGGHDHAELSVKS